MVTKDRNNPQGRAIHVLMAAGGSGLRVGTAVPKQFLLLGDKPMYWYSLDLFLNDPLVGHVLMGLSRERIPLVREELERYFPEDLSSGRLLLYEGGRRRQDTVYRGMDLLKNLSEKESPLLVHDAARPFLSREILDRAIESLLENHPMAVGIPLADTLWRSQAASQREEGSAGKTIPEIESLVPRDLLYRAQTPQGAPLSCFLEARQKALDAGDPDFTDEAGLLLWAGFSVRIVYGSEDNRKITTPEDLSWAQKRVLEKEHIQSGRDSRKEYFVMDRQPHEQGVKKNV